MEKVKSICVKYISSFESERDLNAENCNQIMTSVIGTLSEVFFTGDSRMEGKLSGYKELAKFDIKTTKNIEWATIGRKMIGLGMNSLGMIVGYKMWCNNWAWSKGVKEIELTPRTDPKILLEKVFGIKGVQFVSGEILEPSKTLQDIDNLTERSEERSGNHLGLGAAKSDPSNKGLEGKSVVFTQKEVVSPQTSDMLNKIDAISKITSITTRDGAALELMFDTIDRAVIKDQVLVSHLVEQGVIKVRQVEGDKVQISFKENQTLEGGKKGVKSSGTKYAIRGEEFERDVSDEEAPDLSYVNTNTKSGMRFSKKSDDVRVSNMRSEAYPNSWYMWALGTVEAVSDEIINEFGDLGGVNNAMWVNFQGSEQAVRNHLKNSFSKILSGFSTDPRHVMDKIYSAKNLKIALRNTVPEIRDYTTRLEHIAEKVAEKRFDERPRDSLSGSWDDITELEELRERIPEFKDVSDRNLMVRYYSYMEKKKAGKKLEAKILSNPPFRSRDVTSLCMFTSYEGCDEEWLGYGTVVKWMVQEPTIKDPQIVNVFATVKHNVFGKDRAMVPRRFTFFDGSKDQVDIETGKVRPLMVLDARNPQDVQIVLSGGFDFVLLRSPKFSQFKPMESHIGPIPNDAYIHVWQPPSFDPSNYMMEYDIQNCVERSGKYCTFGEGSSGCGMFWVDPQDRIFFVGVHFRHDMDRDVNDWIRVQSDNLFAIGKHLNSYVPQGCSGWINIKDARSAGIMMPSTMYVKHISLGGRLGLSLKNQ